MNKLTYEEMETLIEAFSLLDNPDEMKKYNRSKESREAVVKDLRELGIRTNAKFIPVEGFPLNPMSDLKEEIDKDFQEKRQV